MRHSEWVDISNADYCQIGRKKFFTGSSNSAPEFCFVVKRNALMVICFAKWNQRVPKMYGFFSVGCLFLFATIVRIHDLSALNLKRHLQEYV